MKWFSTGAWIHIVGIGGSGMSGVARFLNEAGFTVSGSDAKSSPVIDELREIGVRVDVGHDPRYVEEADVVLWSPAVAADHVELEAARAAEKVLMERSEFLAALTSVRQVIGVAGTHGKTTATSMLAHVLAASGSSAGRLLGADVVGLGHGGHWGRNMVALEVDESYGTFTALAPQFLGLLNVEADHLDFYGSVESLHRAFAALLARAQHPPVVWRDDTGVVDAVSQAAVPVVSVGRSADADWRVTDEVLSPHGSRFVLRGPEDAELALVIPVVGHHLVADAAVVAVLARQAGVADAAVARGLANFVGAPRRFQRVGAWRSHPVIVDYAHLPAEIEATLSAASLAGIERPLVVFQPHRVTRTLHHLEEFAGAFRGAGAVIISDIYSAGDENPDAVTGEILVEALQRRDGMLDVRYVAHVGDLPEAIESTPEIYDGLLILGAGDVNSVVDRLPLS